MRILLDTCVWGGSKRELESVGHDVIWSGDWPRDPGDDEILAKACEAGRILITLDKDFGEMVIFRGLPHCGIVRLVGLSATRQASICITVLDRYGSELKSGAIVTVTETRVRIRPRN